MQIVIGEGTNVRRPAQTVLAFLHDFKQDDEVTCVHEIQIESICSDERVSPTINESGVSRLGEAFIANV